MTNGYGTLPKPLQYQYATGQTPPEYTETITPTAAVGVARWITGIENGVIVSLVAGLGIVALIILAGE